MNDPKYGSHLPVLLRLLEKTSGPVLEMGMGLWSTPMLHLMCEKDNRPLVSYDSDKKWAKDNLKWSNDYHRVGLIEESWDEIPFENEHWSVVLIDQRPGIRRHIDALRLKDKADFIVIHDSEPEGDKFYRYSKIYKYFKYVYHYTKVRPHTTVLSNLWDPEVILS